jgi:hypothetical protein
VVGERLRFNNECDSVSAQTGLCAVEPWLQRQRNSGLLIFTGVMIGLHSRGQGTTPRFEVEAARSPAHYGIGRWLVHREEVKLGGSSDIS